MEKNLELSLLCDIYGSLLSQKQREALDLYYNEDLSLSEIASQVGISRQGVRDQIKHGEKLLLEFEENLGLLKKESKLQSIILEAEELNKNLSSEELSSLCERLRHIFE